MALVKILGARREPKGHLLLVQRAERTHSPPEGQSGSRTRAQEMLLPPKCPLPWTPPPSRPDDPSRSSPSQWQVRNNPLAGGSLICSICRLLWCKYSHHGQSQGTSMRSLEQGWEEMLVSHHYMVTSHTDTRDVNNLKRIDQSKIISK